MAKTIAVADQQTTGMERLKSKPQEFFDFLKDVRSEMRKVVAPTRSEVILWTMLSDRASPS
jgi:preprotein translocase subunit SecE